MGLQLDMKAVMRAVGSDPPSHRSSVKVPVLIKAREATEAELKPFTHPEFETLNDAGLLLVFRAPSSFSTRECGKRAAAMSFGAANTLIHKVSLGPPLPGGVKARASAGGDSGGIPSAGTRVQEVDAIGMASEVRVEEGDCAGSVSISAKFYELIDDPTGSLLLWPVSDRTIERFHTAAGYNDPYLRSRMGMDQVRVNLQDPKGGAFKANSDQAYLMGFRIKGDRFKTLQESGDFYRGTGSKTTLNYGGQILLPGEKPFGQGGVGVHANLTHTRQIASNWLATVAAGVGANVQTQILGGYSPFDDQTHISKNGTIAAGVTRVDRDREGRTSIIVTLATQDSMINGARYEASGGPTHFLERQSYLAATDNENSLTLALIRQWGPNTVEVQCKEDFNRKLGSFNGNNNQDFFCGFRYKRSF